MTMTIGDKLTTIKDNIFNVYIKGSDEGYSQGYDLGYDMGRQAGKQNSYDTFWDSFQNYGNRSDYSYAFSMWNDVTFKPKYKITPVTATGMFQNYASATDVSELVDLTNCTSCQQWLYNSGITRVGNVDATKLTTGLYLLFQGAKQLKNIDQLIINQNVTNQGQAFNLCESLENIIVEGIIGCNIDMRHSTLLTKASIKSSIINSLSGTATGLSLTLSLRAINCAFNSEPSLYNPLNREKGLVSGKLLNWANVVTSDYIDCSNFSYIAINKGGSYGWYSDKSENSIVASENKSVTDTFRCYQKPEGAVYCRITSPINSNVLALGYNTSITSVGNGINSNEWTTLIGAKPNYTITLV